MKRYCIKCRSGRIEYFDIIGDTDDEYTIRLTRVSDGSEKTMVESMSKSLFQMCLKTGYVFELEQAVATVA
ncbi:MAG: hypothetical protein FWG77_00130 [Treponema sp.]|nr:hypothetical protein [Treponema sp.]